MYRKTDLQDARAEVTNFLTRLDRAFKERYPGRPLQFRTGPWLVEGVCGKEVAFQFVTPVGPYLAAFFRAGVRQHAREDRVPERTLKMMRRFLFMLDKTARLEFPETVLSLDAPVSAKAAVAAP